MNRKIQGNFFVLYSLSRSFKWVPRNVKKDTKNCEYKINYHPDFVFGNRDGNYKRTVIACFIQAVYLLERDRQENKSEENALAPKWWIPFKYKLPQTLIGEKDALANLVLIRPSGAPRAVLALGGTLLKSLTIRRDIEDDPFFASESLKGSVRFKVALEALKLVAERYGSSNVCVAGHSLGAGFALQVGKH
ncbi:hypothetical protein UlMin_024415 [Ulmus minor]